MEDERYTQQGQNRGKGQKRLRVGPVASSLRALERAGAGWGKHARLDTLEQRPCRRRKSAYPALGDIEGKLESAYGPRMPLSDIRTSFCGQWVALKFSEHVIKITVDVSGGRKTTEEERTGLGLGDASKCALP